MRLNGKKIEGPNSCIIVIPRQSGDLVFKAQAVLDFDDFKTIYPEPTPPEILYPGGEKGKDLENPNYIASITEWAGRKTSWMVMKSLEATVGLEWETIDFSKPETWDNYKTELQSAGFSPIEIMRIINCVMDANGLNQDRIDEAMKRFLAGQGQEPEKLLSPHTEQ